MVRSYFNRWKKNQMIKAAKDSIGSAAKNLLLKLSGSAAVPEDHYCREVLQKESSRLNDEPLAGNDETVPKATLFVPPVAAAGQLSYKPTKGITSTRRCAWAPFCKLTVDKCGGSTKSRCKFKDNYKDISEEEFEAEKAKLRKEEKRADMARRRLQAKTQQATPNA